jgi:cellulose synthase/poly-beta-1,6-N-acetylglucosamine synthase-like glycosyltransferase
LLSVYWTASLILFALISLDLGHTVWAQKLAFSQDPFENISNQTDNRLDTIVELLEQSRQGSIIQLYITIIVFMMGLAFVIFGLYIGQEQRLSVFTRRLYLIAYFALVIPITVILVRYIVNTMLFGALDDPILIVALLLLIPVTASYILMLVKSRHDIVRRS